MGPFSPLRPPRATPSGGAPGAVGGRLRLGQPFSGQGARVHATLVPRCGGARGADGGSGGGSACRQDRGEDRTAGHDAERAEVGHVVRRRWRLARPLVTVTDPPATGAVVERDVPIVVRDGTVLRANVFRPPAGGPHPVILCAHPYGKDRLPTRRRRGGCRVPTQFRILPQSEPLTISAWTGWEGPDPAVWVAAGYAVVNADLRGWDRSDGRARPLDPCEPDDLHDIVEWAARPGRRAERLAAHRAGTDPVEPVRRAAAPAERSSDPFRGLVRLHR